MVLRAKLAQAVWHPRNFIGMTSICARDTQTVAARMPQFPGALQHCNVRSVVTADFFGMVVVAIDVVRNSMPRIEIDEEVYEALKEEAEPFTDTPNSVLRRKLGLEATEPSGSSFIQDESEQGSSGRRQRRRESGRSSRPARRSSRRRAPRGSLLEGEAYEVPILQVLAQHSDGRAPTREVIDAVGELVEDRLTPLDLEKLASGSPRWRNRVQFARLRLAQRGLIAKSSPRGVWEITDDGRTTLTGSRGAG